MKIAIIGFCLPRARAARRLMAPVRKRVRPLTEAVGLSSADLTTGANKNRRRRTKLSAILRLGQPICRFVCRGYAQRRRCQGTQFDGTGIRCPVVSRVADEIAAQVRQNQNEILMTLEPPELGSLRIMLTVDGDKVQARIIAEVHESGNLIHNHLPELKEALQGHRLDLVDVHIDSGNWNGAGRDPSQNFGREFGAERQGAAEENRPTRRTMGLPSSPTNQPAPRSGRVSMWA